MEQALDYTSAFSLGLYGLAALVALGLGIYWLFNKKAKQRQLAELRAKLDEFRNVRTKMLLYN